MPRLRFHIAISLDGFVAGPAQSADHPLGRGGMALHEWFFGLQIFQETHGIGTVGSGRVDASSAVVAEWLANTGATIMGRNMFGGHPGPWDPEHPWHGWWGDDPPFHGPVFVLTNHPRPPLVCAGGTTFHFVTEGIHAALTLAQHAAGDRDITLGGGADVARQYLRACLVDEMELSIVPILLGSGARLFEDVGTDLHGLQQDRVVAAPGVTHLRFSRPPTSP